MQQRRRRISRYQSHAVDHLIDPAGRVCTLFTEPKSGEYSVRRITKFGELVIIPAAGSHVTLRTDPC